MKKLLHCLILALTSNLALAQTTTFDNLNANPLSGKAITWTSSNFGNGFGHRIVNADPGGFTLLKFQGRHNSTTWSDILSLTTQGNIGIGTNNPLSKLHLYKGASNHVPHSFSDFSVEDDDHVMISLMTNNTKSAYYAFADSDDDFVGGIQYDHTNDKMLFRVNNREADLVIDSNGRVAVGKTSALAKFDVEGGIRSSDGSDNVTLRSVDANSYSEIIWGDDVNDRFRFYYNYWNGTASDKEVMTLLANGNVGIGTPSPDSKLAVNGVVHAKEVKVDLTGWPDYVFKGNYTLPTLNEVEKHINENGRLINIPSAAEVENKGVELGEMNKLLLEKIEELTLYILQQQKLLDEQVKENNNLEKRIKILEKIVTTTLNP
ncbi:hypothetical protein [Flagellimonas lutimaris]|uniref:hypothetical protein n=1 Tax=Flagellimonas lutimaris TaxID=475082 RepID=UPI003F5CF109